jgi:hypothetical protein
MLNSVDRYTTDEQDHTWLIHQDANVVLLVPGPLL